MSTLSQDLPRCLDPEAGRGGVLAVVGAAGWLPRPPCSEIPIDAASSGAGHANRLTGLSLACVAPKPGPE